MYQNKPICADLTPEVRGLFWGGAVWGWGWFLFPPRTSVNGATWLSFSPILLFFLNEMDQRKTKEDSSEEVPWEKIFIYQYAVVSKLVEHYFHL